MGFLRRMFGRNPSPPPAVPDIRNMNEDWRAGDLAVCLSDSWMEAWPFNPKRDDVLRVSKIVDAVGSSPGGQCRAYFLEFVGKPVGRGWVCTAFRKLRHVHEPASERFTAFIKKPLRAPDRVPSPVTINDVLHDPDEPWLDMP